MSVCGNRYSSLTAEEGYNMEFRSNQDDAWYSVRLLLESDKLRVKYESYPDDFDDVFLAGDFKSEETIKDFVGRFRTVSAQLQDRDCSKVIKGITVCASDTLDDGQILFHDAVVEDVLSKKHSFMNGEEVCECIFLICWLHGPNVGNVTYKGVANICLPQDSKLHPKLASFVEVAKRNSVKALEFVSSTTNNDLLRDLVIGLKENNSSPILNQKRSFPGSLRQGKHAERSLSELSPSEGGDRANKQDADVGGDKKFYLILVQNLEKELSSVAVSKFIDKQISIVTQVYILPNLPWESYTNGIIMMNCKDDVERLSNYLQDPKHFIVSSIGRPWVVTEEMSMNDHWTLMFKSPSTLLNRRDGGFSNELKVVCRGTKEYKKAKELRDIFLQFIDHQKRLHRRLCAEEISIS